MMSFVQLVATVIALVWGSSEVLAQTWCGKNYMANSPIVPPGGQFPIPATSSSPLLAFRCAPATKPYLAEDALTPGGILIDTYITNTEIVGAEPITLPTHNAPLGDLSVQVKIGDRLLTTGLVPLNATKVELPFSLLGLQPRSAAYEVSCTASYHATGDLSGRTQTFETTAALSYLPDPPDGRSVTKMDLRTGALLARPASGKPGPYEPVFASGFYTGFGGYLASNLSIVDELKEQGFTVIHLIPTYDNITALLDMIERMEQVGIYLMYDMRWTYMNLTAVTEEVNRVKNSPALLLWYTGDEPDGTSDPLNATRIAYDKIYELDGYHPVSLVLNCQNYYWSEYTNGTDIVMQDTYMIGNNVTFSSQWGTPCTPDYGDCGCDNCKGEFEDISDRMDDFAYRLWVDGWERTKAVWTVPQGFGEDTYWPRDPTGNEFAVQTILGINHGGLGYVSWDLPTTTEIQDAGSALADAFTTLTPYLLNPSAEFQHVYSNRIDIGFWTVEGKTAVLATNLNYAVETFDLGGVRGVKTGPVHMVLSMGAMVSGGMISFESVGSAAFVLG